MEPVLGIVGGMGPLASAEFMATLYEFNLGGVEQEAPRCLLYSDPSVPDRTQAIISGDGNAVVEFLTRACNSLKDLGAERFVIPCMTAHYFVGRMPRELKERTISLVDVLMDALESAKSKLLLLATTGTRRSGILISHPRWPGLSDRIVNPTAEDQELVHELIYTRMKTGQADRSALTQLRELAAAYGAQGCVAGCTDLHLLTRLWLRDPIMREQFEVCDPLLFFARQYRRYIHVER